MHSLNFSISSNEYSSQPSAPEPANSRMDSCNASGSSMSVERVSVIIWSEVTVT